jgi:Ras-related protein Rab-2A
MYDYLFKLVVLGDSAVGKSCMVNRFSENQFLHSYDVTIGVEFVSKIINICNKKIKLQIWDTAGQEQFRSIISSYYRNTAGAVICYDSTCRKSFLNVATWYKELQNIADNPKILLVATKCDLGGRTVSFSEGENYAKENNMDFIEVSSKSGKNIVEAFTILATIIYKDFISDNSTIPKQFIRSYEQINIKDNKEDLSNKLCCNIL